MWQVWGYSGVSMIPLPQTGSSHGARKRTYPIQLTLKELRDDGVMEKHVTTMCSEWIWSAKQRSGWLKKKSPRC
jgi:hypothetical protein